MAPNAIDEPLGIKHKTFNKQVQDAIKSQQPLEEKEFVKTNNDLDNLKKIDLAGHNKDIDYILSVLKSDDMLYVSRAIKKSPWLVDDQYANIINPEFLNEHLFPNMKTKAGIKLLKHIRECLKNESRVEEFYNNETSDKAAAKWLSRCSIPFIESKVSKDIGYLSNLEFKRLCERSVTIFEAAMNNEGNRYYRDKLKAASFLLHTHADKYLNEFDKAPKYSRPTFGPTATELIMKKSRDRIVNNFLKYLNNIHIPTFIENVNREEIKDFLYKFANLEVERNDEYYHNYIFRFETIKLFVKRMPKEQQFEFVKKVFLNKENYVNIVKPLERGTETFAIRKICTQVWTTMPIYHWYEFAPFPVAFDEIKNTIQSESNINEKYSMYKVLLNCAGDNTKNMLDLLVYYSKNSLNDDIVRKRQFINTLVSVTEIYKKDQETWNAFNDIFDSMNIFTEDENDFIQIIILRDILQNKPVAEVYEKKFSFNTLKKYRKNLNLEDQNKVFEYIYMYTVKKVQGHNIETEIEFREAVQNIERLLNVLLDWDKDLAHFPFALQKIKDLICIKKNNSWKVSMSSLYNKKKSWKRLMFEESVVLNPSQNVFVNALKHDPGLLSRYKTDVEVICRDDAISLRRLLRKLRIYWSDSLADSWTKSYLDRLDTATGQKALTRGLCTLLSQESLLDIIKKYAPAQPKIDWNNTNELTLGLQRCFAKNMHIARPQPSADTILLYAKGDFLQYALPSLLAIYYDMGRVESQEHIPKLLNAPVSLQKHGLRYAFIKLKHDDLKFHLGNVWRETKNISIRAVTFGLLFKMMCKEKDVAKAEELWGILEVFIDNLTFKEDKKIYDKLSEVTDVPITIRPKFLVKSYNFFKTLLPHVKIDRDAYERNINKLAVYTTEIMEFMCPEFVAGIIIEHLDTNFCKYKGLDDDMLDVTSSYLLCAKDEKTQINRYEKVLLPFLKLAINKWNEMHEEKYYVRRNFQNLLNHLCSNLKKYVVELKMVVPIQMFVNIQYVMDFSLPIPQNYVILRMWHVIVKTTAIIDENAKREDWQQISSEMVPELGTFCLNILKEDVKAYFPCIFILFQKVLNTSLKTILQEYEILQIYEVLLSDKEFIQAYLLVLNMLCYYGSNYFNDDTDPSQMKEKDIRMLIQNHSSVEVKMHYYSKYGEIDNW